MELILNAKSNTIAECLRDVARSEDSLKSEHHREDMKLVANAKSDAIAQCLKYVSCDKNSLQSEHHREDMELISKAKSDKVAKSLKDAACNKLSLQSESHREEMELIENTIFNDIKMNQDDNVETNYVTFQEKIDAIYKNAVEYSDGSKTKKLDSSVFTLK